MQGNQQGIGSGGRLFRHKDSLILLHLGSIGFVFLLRLGHQALESGQVAHGIQV
jgi:hypothetical protein